jgi:hypothetical protein
MQNLWLLSLLDTGAILNEIPEEIADRLNIRKHHLWSVSSRSCKDLVHLTKNICANYRMKVGITILNLGPQATRENVLVVWTISRILYPLKPQSPFHIGGILVTHDAA